MQETRTNVVTDVGSGDETVIVSAVDVEGGELIDVGDVLGVAPLLGHFEVLLRGEVLVEEV